MSHILLVSHTIESPSPVHKFYNYLRKKHKVITMLHPLYPDSSLSSRISDGKKTTTFKIPPKLQYMTEGIYAFLYLKQFLPRLYYFDLTICFDPLCFLHVYLFKKLLKSKKVIYYNVDYSKTRFQNPLLNFIYQKVNLFAYKKCDYFFCISNKFVEDLDFKRKYDYKNFYIKHTVSVKKASELPEKKGFSIVFAGTIDYTVNFDPVLKALQKLKQEDFPFTLDIYGHGRDKEALVKTITKLKLEKNVFLKGVVNNEILVNEILPHYKIGICPYITKRNQSSLDHVFLGTDLTAKLVEYIGTGLPIITTRLTKAFDVIEDRKFGFLVNDSHGWHEKLRSLLTNKNLYGLYRENAIKYAANYDEKKVLAPIFLKILS